MKSKFIYFIILIVFVYNIENFLEKKKGITTNKNYAIFDSSDYSSGNKMHFMLHSDYYCDNELKYAYLNDFNNLQTNPLVPYSVSLSSEENKKTENNQIISKTKYFTIKKKKDEYSGTKGDYLLLYFGCAGEVEIKNEKKKLSRIIIAIIICSIAIALLVAALIFYCCYWKKKKLNDNNINNIK